MICKLCGKYYLDGDHLKSLFTFSEVCPSCKTNFKPKIHSEVFPYDGGEVHYMYIYEDMSLNIKQRHELSKHLSLIYEKMLLSKDRFDLFVYFEDDMIKKIDELRLIFRGCSRVLLFSLVRTELMYKGCF
jgi:hypothetical protein